MSALSTVPERMERWFDAEDAGGGLALFRRSFVGLWLLYDVIDLAFGMTERSRSWFPHPRSPDLVTVQCILVLSGLMLVWGKHIWPCAMVAAAARTIEALGFFSLNDFFLVSVVYFLLAHSDGGPFSEGGKPKWVRDALLLQLAWVYLTTAWLKLNPDWLDGGHLFVRTQYLARGLGWPYPPALEGALGSIAVDAALSKLAVLGELTLAVVLLLRRPYWLAVALVVAIHVFGAVATNVWFFSASMVLGVLFLFPASAKRSARREGDLAAAAERAEKRV